MNDYKIVIDAGHGGEDPGASGNGIIEKNLTLDISKYMYDQFMKLGIPVTLIRSEDETVDPTERVNRILNSYGNSSDVIVISNHINAGGGDGAEVIYALRNNNTLANLILSSLEAAGQNVRKAYQRRLPSDTSKDYYFIHRNTGNTQPIIVEYGFLDSTADDVNQLKNDYEKLAQAVVDAVAEYIGIKVGDNYYTVQKGDSLWSIAKKYNTTVNELKSLNNLTTNTLQIGQILVLPSKTPTTPSDTQTYTVKSGDSLYKIANQFNTTVDELKSLNNLTTNALQIGQILVLPSKTPTAPSDTQTYTVKSGDSLYKIANQFNTTIDELKSLNNLTTNTLQIGQILVLPSKTPTTPSDTQTYTVKSGDSLYKIANQFNTTVDELKSLNNLSSNLLSIGQILKIPTKSTSTPSPDYINYTVVKGDNLYAIAKKYNTTQNEIMKLNNLSSNLLSIGQILKIPTTNQKTYTVQKGDSLYSIAKKYNTTVNDIKNKNNLTSNTLQIGQILNI